MLKVIVIAWLIKFERFLAFGCIFRAFGCNLGHEDETASVMHPIEASSGRNPDAKTASAFNA
jgi:hypothetical protein